MKFLRANRQPLSLLRRSSDVCFSPDRDRIADIPALRIRANRATSHRRNCKSFRRRLAKRPSIIGEAGAISRRAGDKLITLHGFRSTVSTRAQDSRTRMCYRLACRGITWWGRCMSRPPENCHFLAAIVESADDAIVSKDLNGIITSWNKGAERLFGYTAEETLGKPVTMLIPPDRLDEEVQILNASSAGSGPNTLKRFASARTGVWSRFR